MSQASNSEQQASEAKHSEQGLRLEHFESTVLPSLRQHPSILSLSYKILKNLLKVPHNAKFASINDSNISNKCNAQEYVVVSQFLKFVGFKRSLIKPNKDNNHEYNATTVARWQFDYINELTQYASHVESNSNNANNANNANNSASSTESATMNSNESNVSVIELLHLISNILEFEVRRSGSGSIGSSPNASGRLSKNSSAYANVIHVFPAREGTLVQGDVACQKWCLKQFGSSIFSANNFWNRGANWGNYYMQLSVINLLPNRNDVVYVYWINRAGYVSAEPTSVLKFGQTTCIRGELGHPHVFMKARIRRQPGLGLVGRVLNDSCDFLGGYNPNIRSLKYNGNHAIVIGNLQSLRDHLNHMKEANPNNEVLASISNINQTVSVEQIGFQLIKSAPEDKRQAPTHTPLPTPPQPGDRRGKFWGGR